MPWSGLFVWEVMAGRKGGMDRREL